MRHIPNEEPELSALPDPQGNLDSIREFAQTFNPYDAHGSPAAAAEIATNRRHSSFTDLRICLFFEVRRWRHFGQHPDPDEEQYIRGLVERIRQHLMQREARSDSLDRTPG